MSPSTLPRCPPPGSGGVRGSLPPGETLLRERHFRTWLLPYPRWRRWRHREAGSRDRSVHSGSPSDECPPCPGHARTCARLTEQAIIVTSICTSSGFNPGSSARTTYWLSVCDTSTAGAHNAEPPLALLEV